MRKLSKNRLAFIAALSLQNLTYEKVVDIGLKYEAEFHDTIKIHGKRQALERYKLYYVFLRNKMLYLPQTPISYCKVDRRGIPKPLWPLRPLIKGSKDAQRLALSIARIYEEIRLPIDYLDTNDITRPISSERQKSTQDISHIFDKFLKAFTFKFPGYLGTLQSAGRPWYEVLTALSKGPNGPVVATAHLDARAVIDNPPLGDAITELNEALGQSGITEWMNHQGSLIDSKDSYVTGRLGFSAEAAGKTRKFCIADYWSQLSLKILQHSLYDTLKGISTDATSDQDKSFKDLIKNSVGHETFCFDLSSASDRIPAFMQKTRLELGGGPKLANSGLRVMTDRDFLIKATSKRVRWKVGQPLGLLSSFPSFALGHHDIIQLAANGDHKENLNRLTFFKQYKLLGDDVVIYNRKVAYRYQWLLEQIDVTINLSKSVMGDIKNNQIEFAKRLARHGEEFSSIKHNILSKSNIHSMLDLVEILRLREFVLPDRGYTGLQRILSIQDLLRLRFLLGLRNSEEPEFYPRVEDGNSSASFKRESIIKKIKDKRSEHMITKAMKIIPLDMETILPYLEKEIKDMRVSWCKTTLIDRSIGTLTGSHPIVLALTQTSRELQFIMFALMDDDFQAIEAAEYLPIVSHKSYFHNRETGMIYLSKILLECLQEALNENKADSNKLDSS